ncbi:hypothetical protein KC906_04175 [Candidatus Kaiserbacteria bacterium]|nr:hypothetical protein [Candidatus Kaiserbacteria bacterium]MCB9812259.1 hypothetical protein [Candidatus Nomurabacteria bacterium]
MGKNDAATSKPYRKNTRNILVTLFLVTLVAVGVQYRLEHPPADTTHLYDGILTDVRLKHEILLQNVLPGEIIRISLQGKPQLYMAVVENTRRTLKGRLYGERTVPKDKLAAVPYDWLLKNPYLAADINNIEQEDSQSLFNSIVLHAKGQPDQ